MLYSISNKTRHGKLQHLPQINTVLVFIHTRLEMHPFPFDAGLPSLIPYSTPCRFPPYRSVGKMTQECGNDRPGCNTGLLGCRDYSFKQVAPDIDRCLDYHVPSPSVYFPYSTNPEAGKLTFFQDFRAIVIAGIITNPVSTRKKNITGNMRRDLTYTRSAASEVNALAKGRKPALNS